MHALQYKKTKRKEKMREERLRRPQTVSTEKLQKNSIKAMEKHTFNFWAEMDGLSLRTFGLEEVSYSEFLKTVKGLEPNTRDETPFSIKDIQGENLEDAVKLIFEKVFSLKLSVGEVRCRKIELCKVKLNEKTLKDGKAIIEFKAGDVLEEEKNKIIKLK